MSMKIKAEKTKMKKDYKNIRASVIVPVYNAANTLQECLNSILNQTMTDFEVICIDDGSSDSSWNILNSYANKDSRIRVIRQKNSGPGLARNHGIDLALGEYLFFVDADDYIKPEMLETVCDIGQRQDADIVLFDGDRFDTVTGKRIPTKHFLRHDLLPKDTDVFSIQDCPETIFQISSPQPWGRAYCRKFVTEHSLHFSNLPNSEDLSFTYSCIAVATKITFSTQKFYRYRVGQATNLESSKDAHPSCFVEAYLELANWLAEKNLLELCKKSFGIRFISSIIHSIKTINSENARQAICQRLLEADVVQLHVLDQSNAFYNNNQEARQIHHLLQNFQKESTNIPQISVIIPVFNVEKYLVECLESLLEQSAQNFEILCIDDGSTDSSAEILTLYSRLDSRIRVISGNHHGAAEARNRGIDLARGKYLYFMDSDDLAADTLLEKAYTAAVNTAADIVVFDAFLLDDKTKKVSLPDHCFRKELIPSGKSVFSVVDVHKHIFQLFNPAPWTKFFKRDYIIQKQLRFQDLPNSNDTYFVQMALALANRITTLNERLYFYRVGIAGNLQSKKDQAPDCIIDVYLSTRQKLMNEGIWSLCEGSWVNEFISVMCFSLKTLSQRDAYRKIYERLMSPEVASLNILDHDETYYQDLGRCKMLKDFLSSPIKFADANERDTRMLISGNVIDPIVSVIIPVYNVENYLSDCLLSIKKQTLKNIEIICVDDGSKDNSLAICCQAAKEDSRISVLLQKNSGLSAARNAGIKIAQGRYLYYIDSDDLLESDALQFLVETMEENELDYVFFGGKTFYETEDLRTEHKNYTDYYRYSASCTEPTCGSNLFDLLNRHNEFRAQACMQMVKADLIHSNNILFYDGIAHEDELYTLEVLLRSQRCMAIPEQLYLRRIREDSIITSSSSITRLLGHLVCYAESIRLQEQFTLTGVQYAAIYQMQGRFIYHIRKNYFALPWEERLWIYAFCTGPQRCIYNTLVGLFNSAKTNGGTFSAIQDKRLNDHDTALRYAQEELAKDRTRLNDHDTALKYAQEALAESSIRLNDHDAALCYAQKDLLQTSIRLNDHDAALSYLQADITRINKEVTEIQSSPAKALGRLLMSLARKIKSLSK